MINLSSWAATAFIFKAQQKNFIRHHPTISVPPSSGITNCLRMSDNFRSSEVDDNDVELERLQSLMINSAQPQEGSLKPNDATRDYRDVRDVFSSHKLKDSNNVDNDDDHDYIRGDHIEAKSSSLSPAAAAAATTTTTSFSSPHEFRQAVRSGKYTGPTNGVCPGFMQCNLVVLDEDQAFDFLLFCQRNKKACPLIEVCDVGSPSAETIAMGSDLRTDVPKYCIYRDGKLDVEVEDVTPYWPERSVAFLIGCSFSYDGALLDAGIPLRSVEQNKNVPMYRTNIPCRSAGSLRGNVVVSMKPIRGMDIAKEVEITSKYPHAHGGPVCVGCPGAIGIDDVNAPEWGDSVDILPDEIPVFHMCGITPQAVLMESGVSFAITHSPGHMFVTDLPSDTVK
mmetsp:Transcript_26504/g.57167  ORF Transcript_26504/g.57167 Transcript_26504/m.57167 type:complete len:395 (-) Transcript_26504:65-1249(-)